MIWRRSILSDAEIISRYNAIAERRTQTEFELMEGMTCFPVQRTYVVLLPYAHEQQEIILDGCVTSLQIDCHFGEFELYRGERLIGKSKLSKLFLRVADLETETAKIWYTTLAQTSKLYDFYKTAHKVDEPGMDMSGPIRPLSVVFINAPNMDEARDRIMHIPIICRATSVWNKQFHRYEM